jgi:hypothetical protein
MEKWNAITEEITPKVGDVITVDSWKIHEAVKLQESDWEKASFYVRTCGTGTWLAVNIEITGRTYQWPMGSGSPKCVRIRIEFVGDCEASTFASGWLILREEG